MSDEIEEIKRRIDIVDFISQYITLKKAGSSYKALCPFHQEKVPSFYVSPEKQIFKCFGCGKGGSVIDFLMEYEGLEFIEALKLLAEKAGVKLRQISKPEYEKQKQEKIKLYEINRLAATIYHKILTQKPKAQFVRDYLKQRKISPQMVEEFKLGYAPNSYNLLSNILMSKGYEIKDIHKAGLVIPSDKNPGQFYDRFRDRLMFPIYDLMGNVIGFSGRAMGETEAGKYINSPDTPIYSKSKVLYGLDKSKKAIKEENRAIIVEGQMDLISVYQAGYKNVVASSGTALTPFQLALLGRFTKNLSFSFDQDKAGEEATKRAVDTAHQMGFDVKIIITPKGKDPDECIREDPKLWQKAMESQKNAIDYFFEITFAKYSDELDASSKREIVKELLPRIKNLADEIVQAHFIQKLSSLLNVPEKFLFETLDRIKRQISPSPTAVVESPKVDIGERLVGLILAKPEFQPDFFRKFTADDFENKELSGIVKKLKEYYNKKAVFKINSFKKEYPSLSTKIDLLIFPFEQVKDEGIIKKEYEEYSSRLILHKQERIKKIYEEKIKEAEKLGDREKLKKIIKEFQEKVTGKSLSNNLLSNNAK